MSSLSTEYRRRIEKLLSGKAKVPVKGTNHIDDNWGKNEIYKGELGIDLGAGKLYTSDGNTIVELNKRNTIIEGLQLYPHDGIANMCWINISSGSAVINGKTYWYTSVTDDVNNNINKEGDIELSANMSSNPEGVYHIIYAIPTTEPDKEGNYDKEKQQYKLEFKSIKVKPNELYTKTIDNLKPANSIMLGVCWMPPSYSPTSKGINMLRPWSVSVSPEYKDYSFIQSSIEDAVEEKPSTLLDIVKGKIWPYSPDSNNERLNKVLLKGQVFSSGGSLYLTQETHYCNSIDKSLEEEKIVKFSGSTGSGGDIKAHSALAGLSYEKSGHVGFQKLTTVSTTSPTGEAKNGDFWIQPSEDGKMLEAAYVYVEGAWQMFMSSTRDSLCHKNLNINTINEIAFNGKQKKTFVDVKINGTSQNVGIDCWFVDLETNKRTELEDLENWDSFNNTGKKYKLVFDEDKLGFKLTEDDIIGLYYMEASSLLRADDGLNIWAIANDEIDEDVDEFWKDGSLDPKLILVGEVESDEEIDEDIEEMWKDENVKNGSGDSKNISK